MKVKRLVGLFVVALGLSVPSGAVANGPDFTPSASLELEAQSGSLFNNAFKNANWTVRTGVSAPPEVPSILPTLQSNLSLPPNSQLTFNPGNMPVCPDSQIGGPPVDIEVPVPDIIARCPKSIIGNGTATFLLGRNNEPNDPTTQLIGQVLVFNGGLVGGLPRVKFWAFSYDTTAGIYTESVLQPDGSLDIPIPVLSSDSAVNRLDVAIPSVRRNIFLENQGISITLPQGQKLDYARAKCDTGTFPFSADFDFGRRIYPTGERILPEQDVTVNDVGEPQPCTGVKAVPKLAKPTIKGPAKAKRGKVATYRVTVRNSGGLPVTGVRLRVSGKGVSINTSVGTIAGESSKTVRVKAKFRSAGRVKATFLATSKNGGKQSATKTIRVG